MRSLWVTYFAPSPRGFLGPRGFYLANFADQPLKGPFASERQALSHARQNKLRVEA